MDAVRTQWRTPPPWQPPPQPFPHAAPADGALWRLALDSARRGHRRVAAQRLLMLQALGGDLPCEWLQFCEAVLSSLPACHRNRMCRAASAWAEFVRAQARPRGP